MQITFIRHLPTFWNIHEKLQGRRNIEIAPITKELQEEIEQNQEILKKFSPFDLVLASRLTRTHQSANAYGYQVEVEALLDELDFGPFEGQSKKELMKAHGIQWTKNPKSLKLGESVANLEERIIQFLDKYKGQKNLLVFGHGSWIRAIISYHHYGHINQMNQMTLNNNECITLRFTPNKEE